MAERERLPDERTSICKKISINTVNHEGKPETVKVYIHVGLFPDGRPGEIFLKADRMGSTISGLMDALSMAISVGLQSGVPIRWYIEKLRNLQFPPSGTTNDPSLKRVTSLPDALSRWLDTKFPSQAES